MSFKKVGFNIKLVDKLYWFFMFIFNNDFPIINRVPTYKNELNTIQKII
jgi:hypothetical protein